MIINHNCCIKLVPLVICLIVYALLLGHRQTESRAHGMDTALNARVKYPGVLRKAQGCHIWCSYFSP